MVDPRRWWGDLDVDVKDIEGPAGRRGIIDGERGVVVIIGR